jgi:TolB-like protein
LTRIKGTLIGTLLASALVLGTGEAASAQTTYRLQGADLVADASPAKPARIQVAVVDFRAIGAPTSVAEAAAENLRNALVQHQKFAVIERSQIQQAIREQTFGQTGQVDAKEAIALGKLLGARMIVVGSVTKLGETYTINARFIDVESGQVSEAKSIKTNDENALVDVVEELATALGGTATSQTFAVDRRNGPRMVPTGKSKLLASGLSVLLPGTGQFYNGNIAWGVVQFALNIAGFSVTYLGYQYQNPQTYGLGGLTMAAASLWSGVDSWFTTLEEAPAH